jgi:DNA-binding NarL/FixJ family response regulator
MLATEPDIIVAGTAGTVTELLEMVNRHQPDVVLIDYELPDGDGVTATRTLKSAHPDLQVVMLTSYSNQEVLIGAMEAGCSGYITKHSGAGTIAVAIRQAAAGEAIITSSLLSQLLPRLEPSRRGIGANLTARELEILELLADGTSGRAIAQRLYLSFNTVRNHVQNILDKLGAHSRLQAVAIAVKEGIIQRP